MVKIWQETIKKNVNNNIFDELNHGIFHLFLSIIVLSIFVNFPRFAQIVHKWVLKINIWGKIPKSRISGHTCLKSVLYELLTKSRLTGLFKKYR